MQAAHRPGTTYPERDGPHHMATTTSVPITLTLTHAGDTLGTTTITVPVTVHAAPGTDGHLHLFPNMEAFTDRIDQAVEAFRHIAETRP